MMRMKPDAGHSTTKIIAMKEAVQKDRQTTLKKDFRFFYNFSLKLLCERLQVEQSTIQFFLHHLKLFVFAVSAFTYSIIKFMDKINMLKSFKKNNRLSTCNPLLACGTESAGTSFRVVKFTFYECDIQIRLNDNLCDSFACRDRPDFVRSCQDRSFRTRAP